MKIVDTILPKIFVSKQTLRLLENIFERLVYVVKVLEAKNLSRKESKNIKK